MEDFVGLAQSVRICSKTQSRRLPLDRAFNMTANDFDAFAKIERHCCDSGSSTPLDLTLAAVYVGRLGMEICSLEPRKDGFCLIESDE